LIYPGFAYSSWYENCEFSASVISEAVEEGENKIFEIVVLVVKSLKGSYTDCEEHIGQVMKVEMTHKEAKRYKKLAKGVTIRIYRTAYDDYIGEGVYSSSVEYRSRK